MKNVRNIPHMQWFENLPGRYFSIDIILGLYRWFKALNFVIACLIFLKLNSSVIISATQPFWYDIGRARWSVIFSARYTIKLYLCTLCTEAANVGTGLCSIEGEFANLPRCFLHVSEYFVFIYCWNIMWSKLVLKLQPCVNLT